MTADWMLVGLFAICWLGLIVALHQRAKWKKEAGYWRDRWMDVKWDERGGDDDDA